MVGIDENFSDWNNLYNKFASKWFYLGIPVNIFKEMTTRTGDCDGERHNIMIQIHTELIRWDLGHNEKIAGVAKMLHENFDLNKPVFIDWLEGK